MGLRVLVRGGGDLASGICLRLARSGWQVFVLELEHPLAVRRSVSFAQAVYSREIDVEGVVGRLAAHPREALSLAEDGKVAVLVDPEMATLAELNPDVLVDARMLKQKATRIDRLTQLDVGLGPGFEAGVNCHAVIETRRGPNLGRVYWSGGAEEDTGVPDSVGQYQTERVLRAEKSGEIRALADIGDLLACGAPIARVGDTVVSAPFEGVLRGLVQDGLAVTEGMKIGDLDPRCDRSLCFKVSDKALAVAGGVLESILTVAALRNRMWRTA